MKKLLLILLCLPFIGFGQNIPQGINYQAVARDSTGAVLVNQALTIQFSVISDITTSAISWQETHTATTNNYGLFTAIIGQGTSTSVGSALAFDIIDWGASNHLLKVEIDYGNGYLDMGTTAFMSVPYSLSSKYADTALNIRGISHRDFSNDIPGNSPGWYCIATLNPTNAGEKCRGLFSLWDNTSGVREQITFYAGVSYTRGAFLDVVSHNCYGCGIDSIKIQSSNNNLYGPVNIYVFRNYTSPNTTRLTVGLNNYLSVPSEIPSGINIGEWELTSNALPISSEKNLICDLTKTKGLEPYSYTTLNKNFQGSVSRSTAVLEDDDLTTKQYVDNRNEKVRNYPSIDSACSAIESTDSTIQIAFATDTTNNLPSISTMLYKGANGKPYILGSPTKVDFLINWKGNSSGGETFNLPSNAGSAVIKTASIIYDSYMYGSTGITKYWYPMASGFITAARLENLNTKMEFNNSTGSARDISLELWITTASNNAYISMVNGDNSNRFATRIASYHFSLPTGTSSKFFNNISTGGSFKLVNEIPTYGSSGQIGYFNEDDYIGVYWVIRSLSGHIGTITVTPKRNISINSNFNRSSLTFNAYLFTEIIEPPQN